MGGGNSGRKWSGISKSRSKRVPGSCVSKLLTRAAIDPDRDTVNQRKRLRVFGKHGCEHPHDNVTMSRTGSRYCFAFMSRVPSRKCRPGSSVLEGVHYNFLLILRLHSFSQPSVNGKVIASSDVSEVIWFKTIHWAAVGNSYLECKVFPSLIAHHGLQIERCDPSIPAACRLLRRTLKAC